jgi:type II secretory pathway component PulF
MPRFAFTARDRAGQSVQSTLEAPSRKDVLRILAARGLQPVRVSEDTAARPATARSAARDAAGSSAKPASARTRGRVRLSRAHRLPFLTALHDLTSSGLSAGEAIRLLSQRLKDPALRQLCGDLWERISEGAPLSRALAANPEVFDDSTLNLIAAGEITGNLTDTLGRLITHLGEQKELQRQLVAALAYPAFMMLAATGLILFFLFFLLPRIQGLLTSLGGQLPLSTRLLVGLSDFALAYGLFLVGAVVFGAVSFWRWRASAAGRRITDGWALRLPLIGPFAVNQTVLAFSQTLSVLLENGITAAEALRMTERQIQNRVHQEAFRAATDRVLEGEALSVALARTGCFPDLVLDQLAIGENTGNIVPSLKKIATAYQRRLSLQLHATSRIFASTVLIAVFLFVGFMALAIVQAVLQLSSSFKL